MPRKAGLALLAFALVLALGGCVDVKTTSTTQTAERTFTVRATVAARANDTNQRRVYIALRLPAGSTGPATFSVTEGARTVAFERAAIWQSWLDTNRPAPEGAMWIAYRSQAGVYDNADHVVTIPGVQVPPGTPSPVGYRVAVGGSGSGDDPTSTYCQNDDRCYSDDIDGEATLDSTPPAVDLRTPFDGAMYAPGEDVAADFSCEGAVTCEGTVDDGDPLDTASAGTKTFTVTATDENGLVTQRTATYDVTAPLVVTSTDQGGDGVCDAQCTLRDAITIANWDAAPSLIRFDIPGDGPHVIEPTWPMNELSTPMMIDGHSQPGAEPNTAERGWNGDVKIELRGPATGEHFEYGLVGRRDGTTIRGIAASGFRRALEVTGPRSRLEGSLGGFAADGTPRVARTETGLVAQGGATLGGPEPWQRNVGAGTNDAILADTGGDYRALTRVINNYAGTTVDGTATAGGDGLTLATTTLATDNVAASASLWPPVYVSTYGDVRFARNTVGLAADGTTPIGQAHPAISAQSFGTARFTFEDNTLSGTAGIMFEGGRGSIVGNRIIGRDADPYYSGVMVNGYRDDDVLVSRNRISGFGFAGIDMGGDAYRAPNDPLDADEGTNGTQNHPVITGAEREGATTTVEGILDSSANGTFVIELFGDDESTGAAKAQGARYLGSTTVTTDAGGHATFSLGVSGVGDHDLLTATATAVDGAIRRTSEPSPAVREGRPPTIVRFLRFPAGPTYDSRLQPWYVDVQPTVEEVTSIRWDCNGDLDFDDAVDLEGELSGITPCRFPTPGPAIRFGARVTDADGSAVAHETIEVLDAPPAAQLQGPTRAAREGRTVTYGYFPTPSDADVTESCGENGVRSDADDPVGDMRAFNCTFTDGDGADTVSTVRIDVHDDGATATDSATVAIANVAPSADVSGPTTVNEGATETYTYALRDPGQDPLTVKREACFGGAYVADAAPNSFGCRFYGDRSAGYADVIVHDGEEQGSGFLEFTIANLAPTVTLSGPATVAEGEVATYTYEASDAGDDVTVTESCGDGEHPPQGGDRSFTCRWPDGPGSAAPRVTVSDGEAAPVVDDVAVTVTNAAPVVTVTGGATADEGTTKTYRWSATDAGDDTIGTGRPSCGDHGVYAATGDPLEFTCRFPDGPQTSRVSVEVDDSDGTTGQGHVDVAVADVAPTVTFTGDDTADEGQTKTYTYAVTDPGDDPATLSEDCGTAAVYVPDGTQHSFACTFRDGPVTSSASVGITEGDDETLVRTFPVEVANVLPSVTISGDTTADEGQTKQYTWTATDPGDDTLSGAESCGERATYVADTVDKQFGCRFLDGPADSGASVTVSDGDGTAEPQSVAVTVNDVAPTLALTGPDTANEGETKTYDWTVTDPGVDEATVHESCGEDADAIDTPAGGSFDCRFTEGPTTQQVSASIAGGESKTIDVAVADAAPTVALDGPTAVTEGSTHTYTWSYTDPGEDDPGPSEVDVSCGDGGTFVDRTSERFRCRFGRGPGTTTVRVRATQGPHEPTAERAVTIADEAAVGKPDAYATDEDTPLDVAAPGVLANDTDAGGGALTAGLVAGPAHGTLALKPDGSFRYTPVQDWNGTDTFRYRPSGGGEATVTLTVRPVDEPKPPADEKPKDSGTPPTPAPPAPPAGPFGFVRGAPTNVTFTLGRRLSSDGRLEVRLRNANPFWLSARLDLLLPRRAKGAVAAAVRRRLATSTVRLAPNGTATVRLKLDAATSRRLGRGVRLRRVVRLKLRDSARTLRTVSRTASLPSAK